jgi:hypothetical protein
MFDVETGRLKRAGRVTHWVKQVSSSRFDTPAGLIDAILSRSITACTCPMPNSRWLGLGCRLDDGPVFGSGNYTLTKLGLFTETKTASAALTQITDTVSPLR